jgi:hypothetical protein
MSILDKLPSKDQLSTILAPILGDGNGGGVSGAATLLGNIQPDTIASSIGGRLDGALSSIIPSNSASSLTGGVTSGFQQALAAVPSDPSALTAPVRDIVTRIADQAQGSVRNALGSNLSSFSNLGSLDSLSSFNPEALLAQVTPALTNMKGQLVSGRLGQLRGWSDSVEALRPEIDAIVAADGSSAAQALIALLARVVAAVVRSMVPGAGTEAESTAERLRDATAVARLSAISDARAGLVRAIGDATASVKAGAGATAAVATAEQRLAAYVATLGEVSTRATAALDQQAATPAGLAAIVGLRLAAFEHTEIVDLGAVREELSKGIEEVAGAVRDLHLERIGDSLREAFTSVDDAIAVIDLRQFQDELDQIRSEMHQLTASLESTLLEAVAVARDALGQAHDTLRSVLSEVGDFDADGAFHFKAEQEIRDFLAKVQQSLDEAVRPILDELHTTVHDVAVQAEQALQQVQDQLTDVKRQLNDAIGGAVGEIESADLPGQIAQMRDELATVLQNLGSIDFDVVVDPVVQEMGEIGDSLSQIDTSSLNDLLREALKAAVSIITSIDFSTEITAVLTKKMDELMAIPANALEQLQEKVQDALARFGELALHELLAPLYELYTPVQQAVDSLQLSEIVKPLDDWHARALAEVDKVSPAALLQPVVDLYQQLADAVASVSPSALVEPLKALLEEGAKAIESVDVSGISKEVRGVIATVRAQLQAFAPDQLLAPVVAEFQTIYAALDAFDPKSLLQPVTALFDQLTAPLAGLTDDEAKAIETAGEPLVSLPSRMDPRPAFTAMSRAFDDARRALDTVDVGGALVELRAGHAALRAAVAAAPAASALVARVSALDPMQHAGLGGAAASLRSLSKRLDEQFSSTDPPAELVTRYEAAKPTLDKLVPEWLKPPVTPATVRAAFTGASLLGVGTEIDDLWKAIKEQLRALDPAQLQTEIKESYDHLVDALTGLDPAVLLDELGSDLRAIAQQLRTLDLGVVTQELDAIAADIRAVVGGLDPKPVIDGLDAIKAQVRAAVEELRPSTLLAELQEPLESVKAIVHVFSPDTLAEPLHDGLTRIEAVVAQIDLTILLGPVNDKLHELRDDLDTALDRTETAFDGMLQAVPF